MLSCKPGHCPSISQLNQQNWGRPIKLTLGTLGIEVSEMKVYQGYWHTNATTTTHSPGQGHTLHMVKVIHFFFTQGDRVIHSHWSRLYTSLLKVTGSYTPLGQGYTLHLVKVIHSSTQGDRVIHSSLSRLCTLQLKVKGSYTPPGHGHTLPLSSRNTHLHWIR